MNTDCVPFDLGMQFGLINYQKEHSHAMDDTRFYRYAFRF